MTMTILDVVGASSAIALFAMVTGIGVGLFYAGLRDRFGGDIELGAGLAVIGGILTIILLSLFLSKIALVLK